MKIITSNTSKGAYLGVVGILAKNMDGTSKNIVIAPDRFTASVERGLISALGIESTFGIEVMSFTRLASKLIGNDIKKCLTPEGSVMLIGKVIADNRDKLCYYQKVALQEGFASELYAALTAVRNSGISSQDLLESSKMANVSLQMKAKDLALIYDGYLAALEGKHSDSSTRLYALAEFLKQNPSAIASTNFYITDIYDFSAPELEIIKSIANNALSLTVGITSGYSNPNKRIYPDRVAKKLASLCEGRVQIERNDESLPDSVDAISKKLFSYISTSADEKAENNGKVALRSAKDRSDEVMRLALDVAKGVREGRRYKDFEVYASDLDAYGQEIKSTFARYEIPYFIDKKELLSEQAKARFILQTIACYRTDFRLGEVCDFIKNPLFSIYSRYGEEGAYLFENYCLKYNVRFVPTSTDDCFKKHEERKIFNAKEQKSGFIYANIDDKVEILDNTVENVIPEAVRKEVVDILTPERFKGSKNIKVFVELTRELLEKIDPYYVKYVDKIASQSEYFRKCAEQVNSKLEAVLDEIEEVLDEQADINKFESVFKSMIKTLKIALVPTYLDCVFIGDGESRFAGNGDIYVLGANSGKLPSQSGGGVVLTDKDEQMLSALGVEITPCERQKALDGMYAVCDLMKKPQGRLVVSYPDSGDGGALRPSTVVFELQNMLCENGKPLEIERIDFEHYTTLDGKDLQKAALALSTKKACFNEVLKNGVSGRCDANDTGVFGAALSLLSEDEKKLVNDSRVSPVKIALPEKSYFAGRTSVSRLETFFGCPYAHYFNYILSLRKRKDGTFEGTENGTILHFVLEKFFGDVRDGNVKDEDEAKQKAYEYFDRAIKENNFEVLLEKADTGRILARLKEEGATLCKDLFKVQKRSAFRPFLLEAKIGEGKIEPMSLEFGGKKVELKGTIDRVDKLDDKFIIIDYKTYKSADLTLKELYCGQKIQLYVYMRAVERSLGATPCGVFYFPVFSSFTDESGNRYKYKGQACDSRETLGLIDEMATSNPDCAIVPFKTDRKGENLNPEIHLSKEGFDKLGDYAVAIAGEGASKIADGYIKPSPLKDKCKKCDFAAICAYKGANERKMPKVKGLESFDTEGEKNE